MKRLPRLAPNAPTVRSWREPEEPIRAELFSIERLEQHGESLAAAQGVTAGRGRPLVTRLLDNGRVLRAVRSEERRVGKEC